MSFKENYGRGLACGNVNSLGLFDVLESAKIRCPSTCPATTVFSSTKSRPTTWPVDPISYVVVLLYSRSGIEYQSMPSRRFVTASTFPEAERLEDPLSRISERDWGGVGGTLLTPK